MKIRPILLAIIRPILVATENLIENTIILNPKLSNLIYFYFKNINSKWQKFSKDQHNFQILDL